MKRVLIVFMVLLFFCPGCAWFQTKEEKSALELASDGMDDYKSENYKKAIKSFEKLKDWYPFSKYAILAELKIADAHYRLKQYEDAVAAYEEFENLHPRNEAAPYVVYQIGLCYVEQVDTPDRDQTCAKKSLDTFVRLTRQHPQSTYANKAREHIKKCLRSLAESEFRVGCFYYKTKHYRGALQRFKTVVTSYPDVGIHQKALRYIALCEASLKEQKID